MITDEKRRALRAQRKARKVVRSMEAHARSLEGKAALRGCGWNHFGHLAPAWKADMISARPIGARIAQAPKPKTHSKGPAWSDLANPLEAIGVNSEYERGHAPCQPGRRAPRAQGRQSWTERHQHGMELV